MYNRIGMLVPDDDVKVCAPPCRRIRMPIATYYIRKQRADSREKKNSPKNAVGRFSPCRHFLECPTGRWRREFCTHQEAAKRRSKGPHGGPFESGHTRRSPIAARRTRRIRVHCCACIQRERCCCCCFCRDARPVPRRTHIW